MALIRSARLADAPALGRIGVRAWQATYRGMMPDEFLDGLSVEQGAERWSRGLAGPTEHVHGPLVAEDDGSVVGFVVTGLSRDGDGAGEVHVLNVDPAHWRRGLGSLLLTAGVYQLEEAGHAVAILWVVEGNLRARRFYESAGWRVDGGRKLDDRFGTGVVEVRYRMEFQPLGPIDPLGA
jgi:ribosomal protein S18 acetylase RimI-like enzyme